MKASSNINRSLLAVFLLALVLLGGVVMDQIYVHMADGGSTQLDLLESRAVIEFLRSASTSHLVGAGMSMALLLVVLVLMLREHRLRQGAQGELERFFTLSLDLLCVATIDGYFKRINPAFSDTLGWSKEELLARPFLDFVHPDDRAATRQEIENLAAGGKVLEFVNRYQCRDGSWRWLSWKCTPLQDGTIYATVRDFTALKLAEQALRRSEESLYVTLASIGDGVLATDAEGRVTMMNPIAATLTGWTQEQALGRPVAEVLHIIDQETRQPAIIPVQRVLASGEVETLPAHTIAIARDGTERPIADSAAPIRDKNGRVLGVVLVFHDVTEERRALALEKARATVLERLANAATLSETFDVLMRHIERIYPDQPASIQLLDESGRLNSFANIGLPEFYITAIDGLTIGPGVGSCGDAAARGQLSVAADLETHPNWQPYLELTRRAGLGACWSQPLLGEDGRVVGTFGIYSRTPKSPTATDLRLLE